MAKLTDLALVELSKTNLRRTMKEIEDSASSILLLNLRWKDMEDVLDSAQSSLEERHKEVVLKEDELKERAFVLEKEIGMKEKAVKDQFEELKVKEEELGRQSRDLELGKKGYEEKLREVELKQKELENYCWDLELKQKDFERNREDLAVSIEQCEQQCKEVKLREKMINDKFEEIGSKEKDLENCLSKYEMKEEQFRLKEESFTKRCMELEFNEKALEERSLDLEFHVKQCEQQRKEVKLMKKRVKDKLEEIESKERDLQKCWREYELKEEQFGLKEESLRKQSMESDLKEKALEERRRDLELSVKQCEKRCEEVKLMEKSVKDKLEEIGMKGKDLEKRWRQYESKEEQFRLKEKSFEKRCLEYELEEKAFKERCKDLEVKEEGVQKLLQEIKRKEDEFRLKERDFERRCRDVESSEVHLQKGLKDLELKSERCERFRKLKLMEESSKTQSEELKEKEEQFRLTMIQGHRYLAAKQKYNEHCSRDIKLKEKQIEESSKELTRKFKLQSEDLEYKVKQNDQRCMELKHKEKSVKDKFEQIEAKEEQLRSKERDLEQRSKDFKLKEKCRSKDLELKENRLELLYRELECLRNAELSKKEIEELSAEHRRKYEQQSSDLEINVKKCDQRIKDLESKEKELLEWSKELERKWSLASALHPQVKTEACSSSVKISVDHSSEAHLRFCINMDGKDLQMFLNERWKEHGSMGTEVAMALQLSADPAKLVLDAMQGFYPPHLSKGDQEFEGNVARRSCLLLLDQLIKLSPEIKPDVRQEAVKLAFNWITKMRVKSGHEFEVLGFLRLLASFRLADAFDADELVDFLVFIAQHNETPELFKVLGLGDKITGFIKKLVEKKQHMEAIRFIYAFEQVNEFPPVPMLKDFLNHSRTETKRILEKGKEAPEVRNEARTKRIADLTAVVKCIEDHKLESEFQPQNLKNLKDFIVYLSSPDADPSLFTAPVSETPPQERVDIKRPRDAHVGTKPTGFSKNMASKHPKGSKQEQIEELNSKQQDSGKKYDAITVPSSTAPATISTPKQQDTERKYPRTASSQMHYKHVTDCYSWEALARPGDQVSS